MAVKLRFRRLGRSNTDVYRLAAADTRNPRDGAVLEDLGWYAPASRDETKQLGLNLERVQYWLSVGAQPSPTVRQILRKSGLKVS